MRAEIKSGLTLINNIVSIISSENPREHEDLNDLFLAIERRVDVILKHPFEAYIQLRELRIIIKHIEDGLEENKIAFDNRTLALEGAYANELIRGLEIIRKHTSELIKQKFQRSNNIETPQLPLEQAAPIRVIVQDGKLTLLNPQNHIGTIDYPAANRIRESLKETFSNLLEQLPEGSNIDSRYFKACDNLLKYLSQPLEESSIEAFGLNYQLVDKLTKRIAEEAGGVLIDQIEHTLTGVGVLLGQFQEWKDYLEALAVSRVDASDMREMVQQALALSDELSKPEAPVDGKIVARLKEMLEPVVTEFVSAETIAVPLSGSLSNIFSQLSQVVFEHMSAMNAGFQITTGAASAVILANFSAKILVQFCPLLSQFQPLKFLLAVNEYITKYYSLLKDALKLGG